MSHKHPPVIIARSCFTGCLGLALWQTISKRRKRNTAFDFNKDFYVASILSMLLKEVTYLSFNQFDNFEFDSEVNSSF